MGRRVAAGRSLLGRALARTARHCLVLLPLLAGLTFPQAVRADDPVKGEATFSAAGGYARLTIRLAEDVDSDVTTAGSIIVIRFKRPVDVPVDKLADAVPDYVGSARRDPDGSAIRLSLARRATVNTMTAGERIFVDFLPDGWKGPPPSLPAEVIRELSERARQAERALRAQLAVAAAKKKPPVRVRASVQPTFVRFVFEMPDGVNVSSVLNDQKLTLQFNNVLSFDLADAKVAAPPNVASITARSDTDSSAVDILLIGEVDVHSFREEKNYIVDVAFQQAEKPADKPAVADAHAPQPAAPAHAPAGKHGPSQVKPVAQLPGTAPAKIQPQEEPAPLAPVTSEAIAEQANIEIKPGQPAMEAAVAPSELAVPSAEHDARAAEMVAVAPEQMAPVPEQAKEAAKEIVKSADTAETMHAVEAPKPVLTKPAKDKVKAAELPKAESPKTETAKTETAKTEPPKAEAPKKVASEPAAPAGPKVATVEAQRDSDGLRATFAFASPTPAAMFRRADTVWLVFDKTGSIDVEPIRAKGGAVIGDVSVMPLEKGLAVRLRLNRPQMPSLESDARSGGKDWTLTFADRVAAPPLPLMVLRNITDPALANVSVPLANPGLLHKFTDPDAGDTLLVVTAPPPVRGLIKRQDFVEFSLLESGHGVVVHPNSDDVSAEVGSDKVMLGRPGGLTLSSADVAAERATAAVRPLFDSVEWRKNQDESFNPRLDALIQAAANAEPDQKTQARLDLANFYMARGMYHEARGITNLIYSETKQGSEEAPVVMIHAIASILIGHPERGLKDLANPAIGNGYDSQLWKGFAFARQEKWADAREKFKNAEFSIATLPLDLQRIVTADAMRASLEVKDYAGAAKRRSELDVIGVPDAMKPGIAVLRGRLAEALGYDKDALDAYKFAAGTEDRKAAAEGRQLWVLLRQKRGEMGQAEVLKEMETLSAIWRGDSIEVKTLQQMAKIYADTARYSDSFAAVKTATKLQPNAELSRQAQDAASALFAQLYLSPKGEDMKPIDALGMFYEYRELTPIGRRGDEMIRRLADRLVSVDLLDQAADLLQYQVDKRLEGAARAQVAAKLAMVYLTNRKPDRAIMALRSTRIADLSGELRQQRLLLEARAQSDVGRHDLALDIISNITGREAIRLRSDIYWASRQWREASEQIELYYGDRWRDFKPLNALEKADVIRAVVGYALAEDAIGLARFREKFAPLMLGDADRQAFDMASKPASSSSAEFALIAKMAASVDTLDGFIREMKIRFPDAAARTAQEAKGETPKAEPAKSEPAHTGSLPAIVGRKQADASR